jgi:BirA family biotin operon repressor/biotin-[acetyl-CoA-carboxylase] ligase
MTEPPMPALPPGYRLFARESVGSTNDEARDLVAAGVSAGAVVWAESQSAGRGRQGSTWSSPPGNLYCSLVLSPSGEASRLAESALVSALAVRDAVAAALPVGVPVEFKWPNDVMAAGRKVAGVLVETEQLPGEARAALIVGIGINIASAPAEASYPATCIAALARPPRVDRLLAALIAAIDRRFDLWTRDGFAPIRDEWMRHAHRVGSEVAASGGIRGIFAGLDETGAAIIATADGGRRRLISGSIRYL